MYRFAPPNKQRPVVVLTRTSALGFLNQVTIAPISSTIRGIPTEVVLDVADGMKRRCAMNLDHVASVPRKNLGKWVSTLSPDRMAEACDALDFALGCDE